MAKTPDASEKTKGAPNASDTPPVNPSPTPPLAPSPSSPPPAELTSAPDGNLVAKKRVAALTLKECKEELIRLGDPIARRKEFAAKVAKTKEGHAAAIETMKQKERDLADEVARLQDITQVEALRVDEIKKRIAALEAQAKKDAAAEQKTTNQL